MSLLGPITKELKKEFYLFGFYCKKKTKRMYCLIYLCKKIYFILYKEKAATCTKSALKV